MPTRMAASTVPPTRSSNRRPRDAGVSLTPWHFLYFRPLPQWHRSLRPVLAMARPSFSEVYNRAGDFATFTPRGVSPSRKVCRSEEHTSELQSRLHLVCRLLLEKKKKH